MKIINAVLCLILLFFAVLQVNDPDAVLWFAIYVIAAIWPGIAFAKSGLMSSNRVLRLAGLAAIAGCAIGFVANAATITTDWIHVETAREAFGYIICAVAIGFALYTTRSIRDTSLA